MAALGILGAGIWWCTHPTWFRDFGAEEGTVTTPGKAVWAGVTFPNVCTNRPQHGSGITAFGIGGTPMMRRYCIHLVRARDVDMT